MTIADRDIVPALMDGLAGKIGKNRYDLWFGEGPPWQLQGSILRMEFRDAFRRERARGFRREIQQVCEAVAGRAFDLEFDVATPAADAAPDETGGEHPVTQPAAATDATVRGRTADAKRQTLLFPTTPEPASAARRRSRDLSSLVVGESNRMAVASVERILRRPGEASPFLLYGPPGSGKTHLLEALRGEARKRGIRRVVFQTAEQFTSSFVEAIHQGTGLPNFRNKYREVSLLILDDVQFFAGKRATLVELQHTLDSLQRSGGQVVLGADRSPNELAGLSQELRARISGGLVADVSPPDFAMRQQMLDRWEYAHAMPADVRRMLAERLTGDARRLAGAIHRLEVACEAYNCDITLDFAERTLRDLLFAQQTVIGLRDIEEAVCEAFGVEKECLHSKRRDRKSSHPRMLAMWLARKHTRSGLAEIGRFFGKRSHTTVISAGKKMQALVGSGGSVETAQGPCHVEDAIARIERRLHAG